QLREGRHLDPAVAQHEPDVLGELRRAAGEEGALPGCGEAAGILTGEYGLASAGTARDGHAPQILEGVEDMELLRREILDRLIVVRTGIGEGRVELDGAGKELFEHAHSMRSERVII